MGAISVAKARGIQRKAELCAQGARAGSAARCFRL